MRILSEADLRRSAELCAPPDWGGTQGIGVSRRGLRVPFSLGAFFWARKTNSPGANWDIRKMARRAKSREGLRKKYLAHEGET